MGVTHVVRDGEMITRVHNVRDPRGVEIQVNKDGDVVFFELTTESPSNYGFYPALHNAAHLHENDQGKTDPVSMTRTHLLRRKVAFHCPCGLRIVMQAWDLDFGHPVRWTLPQLREHFQKHCE